MNWEGQTPNPPAIPTQPNRMPEIPEVNDNLSWMSAHYGQPMDGWMVRVYGQPNCCTCSCFHRQLA